MNYSSAQLSRTHNTASALGCCWASVGTLLCDCKLGFSTLFSLEDPHCPVTRVYPQAENARGCWEAYSTCALHFSYALFPSPAAPTTCSPLGAPAFGTKFGSKHFVGHEVHFTCSQGYHLAGSATRVCQENGTWSGISAVCKGEIWYYIFYNLPDPNRSVASPGVSLHTQPLGGNTSPITGGN